jgi:DNA repair protein RadC
MIHHDLAETIYRKLNRFAKLKYEVILIATEKEGGINYFLISSGTENSVSLSFSYLFSFLKKNNISKFIMVHNHPGGDSKPSEKDLNFLTKLNKRLSTENFQLIDFIIISENNFYSHQNVANNKGVNNELENN